MNYRNIITALIIALSFGSIAYASQPVLNSSQIGATPVNGYYLKTDGTQSTWSAVSTGTISTSSPLVSGQPLYATGVNTIASVASSTFLTSIGGQSALGSLTGIIMGNAGSFYGTATSSPIAMSITGNAGTVTNGVYTTGAGTVYENPLTFTYPLTRATNAISLAFGTTTSNTWAGTQTFGSISNTGGYTQSGTTANTFTGTPTFSNATYSALFTGGNVGIGTTGPGYPLDVNGNVHATGFYINGNGTYKPGLDGGTNTTNITANYNVNLRLSRNNSLRSIIYDTNLTSETFYPGTDASTALGGSTNRWSDLWMSGSAYIAGNVGIATTSPQSKLTVKGHIGTDGLAPALTSCGTSPSLVVGSTDTAGEFTEGTISTGCTLTFQTAYARAPFCTVTGQAGLVFTYAISASALTITNVGALSSTAVDYHCISNDL